MPTRSFTVISVKSLLYCGLSAASEFSQTPLMPCSGSMYQSVSMHSCWSPVEVPFGFGTQTLKFERVGDRAFRVLGDENLIARDAG